MRAACRDHFHEADSPRMIRAWSRLGRIHGFVNTHIRDLAERMLRAKILQAELDEHGRSASPAAAAARRAGRIRVVAMVVRMEHVSPRAVSPLLRDPQRPLPVGQGG